MTLFQYALKYMLTPKKGKDKKEFDREVQRSINKTKERLRSQYSKYSEINK